MTQPRSVVVEADGGSRGNPGPAAYGAVLRDGTDGAVIAQAGDVIGEATNNVAEYRGLIAGLDLANAFAPGAAVEVRMDSQLVVEQMAGNWKIKNEALRVLAQRAHALMPEGTVFTWIPRERNRDADRLVNLALDGTPTIPGAGVADPIAVSGVSDPAPSRAETPARGWARSSGPTTTLILVRHGATSHNATKAFSGGLGGADPMLTDDGRAQARACAEWLAPLGERIDTILASPLRRTSETAAIIGERLMLPVTTATELAEMEFGVWEGHTLAEITDEWPAEFAAWVRDPDAAAGGNGESFNDVAGRVRTVRDRVLTEHPGGTVVVVSHVTPIKLLVTDALGVPSSAVHRMELSPGSICVVAYFGTPENAAAGSLRVFNLTPGPAADPTPAS